jgi:hypothetical protein
LCGGKTGTTIVPELRIILVIYKLVTFTTVAYIINREWVSFINNSRRKLMVVAYDSRCCKKDVTD